MRVGRRNHVEHMARWNASISDRRVCRRYIVARPTSLSKHVASPTEATQCRFPVVRWRARQNEAAAGVTANGGGAKGGARVPHDPPTTPLGDLCQGDQAS